MRRFPALVGSLYVRNHFHKDSKEIALEISKYVHDEVLAKLKTLDWMDKTTKERAVLKAKDMSKLIAYPDELLDDALLNKTYYGVSFRFHFNSNECYCRFSDGNYPWQLLTFSAEHKKVQLLEEL